MMGCIINSDDSNVISDSIKLFFADFGVKRINCIMALENEGFTE